jgi:peroxiredoxin Q/BCP
MNTLQVGDKVPNFISLDQNGNTVALSDFKGKKLVVFFYPAASTPTCTIEACNLRDHFKELKDAGYEILGVSKDTQRKQKNFSDKYDFPFPLLADTAREVIEAFGVWGPKKFMGRS